MSEMPVQIRVLKQFTVKNAQPFVIAYFFGVRWDFGIAGNGLTKGGFLAIWEWFWIPFSAIS